MTEMSMAQRIALLPPEQREEALSGLDPDALMSEWSFWARPAQVPPAQPWTLWLFMAGRGAGKTRSASEWLHDRVRKGYAKRIALLGRTSADVRDVMIQGESGLVETAKPDERPLWEPSKRRLTWPNGAYAIAFSADEPDQLRGPQFDTAWSDEFASFPQVVGVDGASAFDNLRLGLRLPVDGDMPRMVATTTPRRVPSMFKVLEEAKDPRLGIVITRGTTYDNLANLADAYSATVLGLYEGTRLGQQELLGEMLADVEGAIFKQELFDIHRVSELPQGRYITVVGVDPSVAERPKDECGIVVVKATTERDYFRRHVYVVEDASLLASPATWAKAAVAAATRWAAPIVAEGNQGGALVRMAISQVNPNIPVYIVHAKEGKATRAEPIAAMSEQGRLHLVGFHPMLEAQATSWVPAETRNSPDRVDGMVWATLATVTKVRGAMFGTNRSLRARSFRERRLPAITVNAMTPGRRN